MLSGPGIKITITSASGLFSSQRELAGASLHYWVSAVILGLPITGSTENNDMAQVQGCRFLSEWTCNIPIVKESLAVEFKHSSLLCEMLGRNQFYGRPAPALLI